MSFILDALKKLEQKRQRGSVPDIMTVHFPDSQKPRRRPAWPYIVIVALILNAVLLASWLRPWETKEKSTLESHVAAAKKDIHYMKDSGPSSGIYKESAGVPVAKSDNDKKQDRQARAQKIERNPVHNEPALSHTHTEQQANLKITTRSKSSDNLPGKILNAAPSTPPRPAPASEPAGTIKPEPGQRIQELSQLPQTVQTELPKLTIMGHIYSDNSSTRMVNINGYILREGDTASKNVKIQEITENGVIFNYNGLLFLVRAF